MNFISVQNSLKLSIGVQILVFILTSHALFLKIPKEDVMIDSLLKIETSVQIVEALAYASLIYFSVKVKDMTRYRYYDWFLTTPLMLLTLCGLLEYTKEKTTFQNFVHVHKNTLGKLFIYNALMLFFGYLGETKAMVPYIAYAIGFFFFFKTFDLIQKTWTQETNGKKDNDPSFAQTKQIYDIFVGLWLLYGIFAFTNPFIKNHAFNILDLLSKNAFGVFLYLKVLSLNKQFKKSKC